MRASRRPAALGADGEEELARHHVVRVLVDVAHDLGERLGFVHIGEARGG